MRSVILASMALFSTSAMAGPLAVTASGGASMIGDNPTAMAELDLRPAPILSFATTIQGPPSAAYSAIWVSNQIQPDDRVSVCSPSILWPQ